VLAIYKGPRVAILSQILASIGYALKRRATWSRNQEDPFDRDEQE